MWRNQFHSPYRVSSSSHLQDIKHYSIVISITKTSIGSWIGWYDVDIKFLHDEIVVRDDFPFAYYGYLFAYYVSAERPIRHKLLILFLLVT